MNHPSTTAADTVDRLKGVLAESVVQRSYELRPQLLERYGPRGREHCLRDTLFHLDYLANSLRAGDPDLFTQYAHWAHQMLAARNVPGADLVAALTELREAVEKHLPPDDYQLARKHLDRAAEAVQAGPPHSPSFVAPTHPLGPLAAAYLKALLAGKRHEAAQMILDAAEAGATVTDLYMHVFQATQHEVGRLWQLNRVSVAQEHYCSAATQLIMSQLYPRVFAAARRLRRGRWAVATCVGGNLHEIGARMVADFLEMDGWDTAYLGASTPVAGIVASVKEHAARVLVLSAAMTTQISALQEVLVAMRAQCPEVKVLVGGQLFERAPELWRTLGAHGWAADAPGAVAAANEVDPN